MVSADSAAGNEAKSNQGNLHKSPLWDYNFAVAKSYNSRKFHWKSTVYGSKISICELRPESLEILLEC